MSRTKALIVTSCFASLLMSAGCDTPPATTPAETPDAAPAATPSLVGTLEAGPKEEAEIILYLKADGTLIHVEGMRGGNFEDASALQGNPGGLDRKVADIQIWDHDGTFQDITVGSSSEGDSAHLHSGPVTPPLNTHCHKYVLVGSQWVLVHCP